MRRRLKRWASRPTTTQLDRAAFHMPHAKDVLTIFRDVTAVLGLSTLLFAYVWGVGYYDGLLGSLHVPMADFVEPRDIYSVLLRRGDFIVGLAGQIFLCGLLAGSFAVATRVDVRALRSRTKQVFVLVGKIVCPALVPVMVVLFPLLQARDAGRHDAEVYKADARSFQGKQGCRTVIAFDEQADAPWPTSPKNCASLVGIFGGRAMILVDDATYVLDLSKIRALRFNDWPDHSVLVESDSVRTVGR